MNKGKPGRNLFLNRSTEVKQVKTQVRLVSVNKKSLLASIAEEFGSQNETSKSDRLIINTK